MKIRVYYEDTDAGGIVYHTNYIKYCERARSEYLFGQGIMPGSGSTYGFVVRHISADYYASSVLGDILEVKNALLKMKKTSFVLLQEIYKDEQKIFSMEITLVYVEDSRAKPIPENFKKLFNSM
jgi:acyl-CoA thioester hydrolase